LPAQLQHIKLKIQLLIKQHDTVVKQNDQHKKQIENLQKKLSNSQTLLDTANQKLSIAQLNSKSLSIEDKKALEKKLDSYIKEIESCLALINKH
jgi:Ulp1 family protease